MTPRDPSIAACLDPDALPPRGRTARNPRVVPVLAALFGTREADVRALLRASTPFKLVRQAERLYPGVAGVKEAWERLAARDLVPPDWVENPLRRFTLSGTARGLDYRGDRYEFPPLLALAARTAADLDAFATAELLGVEAAARQAFLGVTTTGVLWEFGDVGVHPVDDLEYFVDHAEDHGLAAFPARPLGDWRAVVPFDPARDSRATYYMRAWRFLATGGARIAAGYLAGMPNPFEPLASLGCLGFAYGGPTPDGRLRLVADRSLG